MHSLSITTANDVANEEEEHTYVECDMRHLSNLQEFAVLNMSGRNMFPSHASVRGLES